MAKIAINKISQQDEFHIDVKDLLAAHVDPNEVLPDDQWSMVDGGGYLILVRRREVIRDLKAERKLEEQRKLEEEQLAELNAAAERDAEEI